MTFPHQADGLTFDFDSRGYVLMRYEDGTEYFISQATWLAIAKAIQANAWLASVEGAQ